MVSKPGIRLCPRHCAAIADNSISAMFNQLPCIGLILMCALLMKKKFSIGYDWADLIIIITAFSVFMYGQLQSSDDPFLALFSRLQSGAYIIFIGLVGALCFLIEATWKSKKGKNKVNNSEIEIDKDAEKKIDIMHEIEAFIPFLLTLFSIYLCRDYLQDLFDNIYDKFTYAFPWVIGIIFSFFLFFILLEILMLIVSSIIGIIIIPLMRLLFFIIDKKTVNYWRKQPKWNFFYNFLGNENKAETENGQRKSA
jgi:hypothetical protein